jgi:hypothetical protein
MTSHRHLSAHVSAVSRPPQFADQSEEIDLAPRLRNLAILDPIDHKPGEFYRTIRPRDAFELATVCRMGGRSENHPITFSDQVVNGVMRIRKRRGELPFEMFQFIPIHRGGTEMAHVIGRNEIIETARKAGI